MIQISSIEDISLLRESVDLEIKLARGADGKGVIPKDFWPTYSAFANTHGGVILLGLRESHGQFTVEGIENLAKVRTELFNLLNSRDKVSVNLLNDSRVQEIPLGGKTILAIEVPRAPRTLRPVHITKNPLDGNSYRRENESDRPIPDEEVKRLLAEQVEDSRDLRLLPHHDLDDLQMETFRAYRQVFANREPAHPWNALGDLDFLRSIGGWRRDRETGQQGLTLAGLLMFGRMETIREILPNYMLDYMERPEARTEMRWTDRLTLDGKWSGNLYDFYRRVYLKLTADLKVPFRLEKGERQEDTPVHVALREALANTLVHADYTDRASVLVVKRPDMFGFRNPGLMRVPVEIALQGGEPDCRNRNLHQMFRFVGVGEQAGTGIPKILQGWEAQHWHPPKLHMNSEPYNQTLLELRMIDLFPEVIVTSLRQRLGARFDALAQEERMALALAASEGSVSHGRLKGMSTSHSVDLTRTLQHLTQQGMLVSTGGGRGAVYHLAGVPLTRPEDVFGPSLPTLGTSHSAPSISHSSRTISHNHSGSSPSGEEGIEERDADGCLRSSKLPLPVIDDLTNLSPSFRESLERLAQESREKARLNPDALDTILLELCKGRYITLRCLAELAARKPDPLRNNYLTRMVRDRSLSLAFPATPKHERQAYCTTASLPPENPR